jgi:hypothetical protein
MTTEASARPGQPASALNSLALSATIHCLTGCLLGEVTGMVIGTALDWSNGATIALAVCLAFLFGYALTSVPLVRAGMALAAVVSTALAADTISISIMETIDNAAMALMPGALEAGLSDPLFWGTLAGGFAVAFPVAFLANRYLIARGKGCALVHAHRDH